MAMKDIRHARAPDTCSHGQPVMILFDSNPNRLFRRKLREEERLAKRLRPTPEIQFVHASAEDPKRIEDSKLIRAHVMRDYMRKKKKAQEKRFNVAGGDMLTNTSPVSSATDASFRHGNPKLSLKRMDIIDMYPIPMTARNLRALQHYFTLVIENFDRVDMLQLCMMEASLFHMLLLSSVIHLNHITANSNSFEADYHRLSAIELVNRRLKSLSNGSEISDATILTVAYLAVSEALNKDYTRCAMHLDGLCKMVDTRGGLERMDRDIQHRVRMADIFGCIKMGLVPHFENSDVSDILYQSLGDRTRLHSVKPSTEFERVLAGVFIYHAMIEEQHLSQ